MSDKRYSYNQHLRFNLKVEKEDSRRRKLPGKLVFTGVGKDHRLVSLQCNLNAQGNPDPHVDPQQFEYRIHESHFNPQVDPITFISVLNNLSSVELQVDGFGQLDQVELETAVHGYHGEEANWVESCQAPNMSPMGNSCVDGYTFNSESDNPYQPCEPCSCNSVGQKKFSSNFVSKILFLSCFNNRKKTFLARPN